MVLECFNFFFEKVSNCPRFSKKQFSFDYHYFPSVIIKSFHLNTHTAEKEKKKSLSKKITLKNANSNARNKRFY